MKQINCPICKMNNDKYLFNVNRFSRNYSAAKCRNCGLIYINPQPSSEVLREHYAEKYNYSYMWQAEEDIRDKDDIVAIIKFKQVAGNIMDVGCGSGLFLNAIKKQGWQVRGVDLSPKAVAFGQNSFGLPLICGDFLEMHFEEKYDVVSMRHFLEHTAQPDLYLKKVRNILKQNALFFIVVPNIDSFVAKISGRNWEWMSPPAHLFFFSPKTIRKLLEKENFEVLKIETKRGDGANLFFSILAAVVFSLGFGNYLRKKVNQEGAVKKGYAKLEKLSDVLTMPLLPLEFLLNKLKKGPEMIIYAKNSG